ncbi:MAG: EutN/CcmL family microcompartment protein [Planctomycetota bacterium]
MMLATVVGNLFATRKHPFFEGKSLLIVREQTPHGRAHGPTFLAVDRVSAGMGDRVLINKEGSGARLLFGGEEIPLQAVIVGVVEGVAMEESLQ